MLNLSPKALGALTLMRILIGWHFLYEGVLKMYNPNWTSKAYLMSAELMTPFFQWLAGDAMIGIVNNLNIVILMLVGLTLVLGIFEKIGSLAGILILLLFYLAHPALPGMSQSGAEGSYWIINKNLIEAAALYVLFLLPTGSFFGLGVFFKTSSPTP